MAIDEAEPPDWVKAHVSHDQLKLNRGLLWVLLIYRCHGLDQSRYSVAQRLYIHTIGKDYKRCNPSIRSLMTDLECSENTAIEAVKDLEERGFLIVRRHGNGRNLYILAWPVEDTTSPAGREQAALCGAHTKKDGTCTRKAGWGTTTPGVGPCKKHGGEPRNPDPTPQPLRYDDSQETLFIPQPLRDEPDAHTSTIEASYLNHCGATPQPLRCDTSTIEVEYVRSALGSTSKSSKPRVLAVGEPPLRNARESRTAPPAQPVTSIAARSLVAGIARYRSAPGWVKRDYLIPMADAALHAGFGRDAITRYAAMVIAEHAFKDDHHIPEFRAALARLGRDHLNGDACQAHGIPECDPCTAEPIVDRPWDDEDQADLEAALDRLGHTTTDTPEHEHEHEHETGTA